MQIGYFYSIKNLTIKIKIYLLFISGKWELDRNDLEIMDILGSGCFGVSIDKIINLFRVQHANICTI